MNFGPSDMNTFSEKHGAGAALNKLALKVTP